MSRNISVSAELESEGVPKPDFLWLFQKTSSRAVPESQDDSREVTVFKLVKIEKLKGQFTATGDQKVKLTYKQVFGEVPLPTPTATPTHNPGRGRGEGKPPGQNPDPPGAGRGAPAASGSQQ